MNQGGDQGHDDYGLPRVDIEIPDDARELYREVQAYHRELRALRRHERSRRWRAPFHRFGIAAPLLAGCLVVALIGVMISAMFTANPSYTSPTGLGSQHRPTASSHAPTASPSHPPTSQAPPPGASTGRLPGKTIDVAGKTVALRELKGTALAIVPPNCECALAVNTLLTQAEAAGIIVYLVIPPGSSFPRLNRLIAATARSRRSTRVAHDFSNVLTAAYGSVGLTVLLVDARGAVTVDKGLGPKLMLESQFRSLQPTG